MAGKPLLGLFLVFLYHYTTGSAKDRLHKSVQANNKKIKDAVPRVSFYNVKSQRKKKEEKKGVQLSFVDRGIGEVEGEIGQKKALLPDRRVRLSWRQATRPSDSSSRRQLLVKIVDNLFS